jgi:ATP-dependent Clp protease ATP-binding subunit ClpC
MTESGTLQLVYQEAERLCTQVGRRQEPHSFYVLMALFTADNPAGDFLRAHGVAEDVLLDHFPIDWPEAPGGLQRLKAGARAQADAAGDPWVNTYHLLLAMIDDSEGKARIALEAAVGSTSVSVAKVRRRCHKVLARHRRDVAIASGAERVSAIPHGGTSVSRAPEQVATATLLPGAEEPPTVLPQMIESLGAPTPTLDALCIDLVAQAQAGLISPLIGRVEELDQMLDILGKRQSNNPLIVGASGVGKTALVEGLAQRIADGEAGAVQDRRLLALEVGSLLAGTALRGSLSERVKALRREVAEADPGVVLFIDEIHGLIGGGESGGGPGAADELKAALARGELPCIGATTEDEYRRLFAKDPALSRRFTPIFLSEPEPEEAVTMLAGAAPAYADHHGTEFSPAALQAAVRLSHRYMSEGHLPAKAFDVLDLAGSRVARSGRSEVSGRDVAQVVADAVRMPVERLDGGDEERLLRLESLLAERVVGRAAALTAIATTLRRNQAGFGGKRPIGSFLLLGPTGVGKTEVARALSEVLFGKAEDMLRFDMGEFSEAHAVSRLIGSPPGYVGHEEGGQLTEAVRRRPYRVLLFDEIEKAHREVLQVLLSLLDEGVVTDARGVRVSFRHCLVVMTSNLGAQAATRRSVGFGDAPSESNDTMDAAKRAIAPELWNRIDEVLAFPPLTRDEAKAIGKKLLEDSLAKLKDARSVSVVYPPEILDWIVERGYSQADGARPMRRLVQRSLEAAVAEAVLAGAVERGGSAEFVLGDDGPELRCDPAS